MYRPVLLLLLALPHMYCNGQIALASVCYVCKQGLHIDVPFIYTVHDELVFFAGFHLRSICLADVTCKHGHLHVCRMIL